MTSTTPPRRQIHLGAHFPGVNSTTVWADPRSGSQIDFRSFEHLARSAERAKLDFFFLAEGLRLREHKGQIYDLDVVGRPDTLPVLAALAAVTTRLGLVGTLSTTYNEPYELARQLATLDVLSGGRAAWNVVTSPDAFTGANFRRGGYLPYAQRYERAAEVVQVARQLWDSGADEGGGHPVEHHGTHVDVVGDLTTPRGPQGHPVLFQAGDSSDGREFAAATADVVFTAHSERAAGRAFFADVKGRLARYGRLPDSLKILPAVTVVLGDTARDAQARSDEIRRQQVSGPAAIAFLEQVWARDLSGYDPDGPLPDVEPDVENLDLTQGRVRHVGDPGAVVRAWRELAAQRDLSIRELVIEVGSRTGFVGTAAEVADAIDQHVQDEASDGFILVPHLTPAGLDEVFEQVVPLLQERGSFRTEYAGSTLRDHLGLALPARAGALAAVTGERGVR